MFIYSRFEDLRAAKGITKKFIADALGRKATICQDWKQGKSAPSPEQLEIVSSILETTPAYLTGETDKKEQPIPENGVELSEKDMRLLNWFRSLPPEKQKAILIAQDAPEDLT